MDNNRQIREPNGPLSWEEERENWKKAMEIQKDGFLSRVQALEEELARRNKYYEDIIESMQKSIDYWHTEDTKARAFVDKLAQHNAGLEEENKRLQERLSAADHVVYTLSPDQRPNWLKLPHNTELAIIKYLELFEKK